MCSILFALAAVSAWPVNAPLRTAAGETVMLASFRGKPAVLFYEDKDSQKLNAPLKKLLFEEAKARGMLDAAAVIAVANLRGFAWFPAREFALAGVQKAERDFGVPVFVDFEGTLSAGALALPGRSSTVVLLDKHGRVAWQHTGALTPSEAQGVIERLLELGHAP